MQNVREYIQVSLHTTAKSALRAASSHTFKSYSIIDENLVQTNHFQHTIIHSTPLAIGVTILELVSQFNFVIKIVASHRERESLTKIVRTILV